MTQSLHKSFCAKMVAHVVQDMVREHQVSTCRTPSIAEYQGKPGCIFAGSKDAGISVPDYIDRLGKYLHVSSSCFVLSLIYIDRITDKTKVRLSQQSVHRLLATSILLAMKYHDDIKVEEASYISTVVGVQKKELKRLEAAFLSLIGFDLFVCPSEFKKYCEFLIISQTPEKELAQEKELKSCIRRKIASMGLCSCGSPKHSTLSPELHNKRRKKSTSTRNKRLIKKGKSQNLEIFNVHQALLDKTSQGESFKDSKGKDHHLEDCHEESTQDSPKGDF
ncbi:unnamed protein product [Moneuplotes crassus]|uniref:Cyclin-like domain-containing protein n=1 Tax=Euplotes crassus TaxID=5936 RepID=A0AAD1UCF7_EUPCR|nr:unnamed protein product [Moneuplotes crassus]